MLNFLTHFTVVVSMCNSAMA